jgi:hypothetical protein
MSTTNTALQAPAYALHNFIRPLIAEAANANGPRQTELDAEIRPLLVSFFSVFSLMHRSLTETQHDFVRELIETKDMSYVPRLLGSAIEEAEEAMRESREIKWTAIRRDDSRIAAVYTPNDPDTPPPCKSVYLEQ